MLVTPRYGDGALADLIPSVLGALGVDGEQDRLGLGLRGVRRVAVLLVDGMGAELVRGRTDVAPFLAGLPDRSMTAGFPSTTAASLGSLGTGLPPGEHGIVGYLLAIPDHQRLLNPLKWRLMGEGPRVDLLKELVPEPFSRRRRRSSAPRRRASLRQCNAAFYLGATQALVKIAYQKFAAIK